MRAGILILAALPTLGFAACHHPRRASSSAVASNFAILSLASAAEKPDFDSEIKPILQSRCMPCHFQGGKVYDKLPFDKPETITRLGAKLFTRIKDEKEQRLIREFLAQP